MIFRLTLKSIAKNRQPFKKDFMSIHPSSEDEDQNVSQVNEENIGSEVEIDDVEPDHAVEPTPIVIERDTIRPHRNRQPPNRMTYDTPKQNFEQ